MKTKSEVLIGLFKDSKICVDKLFEIAKNDFDIDILFEIVNKNNEFLNKTTFDIVLNSNEVTEKSIFILEKIKALIYHIFYIFLVSFFWGSVCFSVLIFTTKTVFISLNGIELLATNTGFISLDGIKLLATNFFDLHFTNPIVASSLRIAVCVFCNSLGFIIIVGFYSVIMLRCVLRFTDFIIGKFYNN